MHHRVIRGVRLPTLQALSGMGGIPKLFLNSLSPGLPTI